MSLKFPLFTIFVLTMSIHLANSQSRQSEEWSITPDKIDKNDYYGITLANGIIGLVSSPAPLKIQEVILNGVYDQYKRGRVSNILQTFSHLNMDLIVDHVGLNEENIQGFTQSLDMKEAKLVTTFDYSDKVSVRQEVMALRNLPYCALAVLEIKAKQDVEIIPINRIEAPDHLQDVRNYYAEIDRPHVLIELLSSEALSPGGKKLAVSNSFIFEEEHGHQPHIVHEDWDHNMHLMKFTKKLKAGETYRFALIGSTLSSVQHDDPRNEAERLTVYAKLEGKNRLLEGHKRQWNELWKSNIEIEGDPVAQKAVRSALYHLYSFARSGTAYSLSPMGLSGLGYNGHVFWDTELWMYPPLLVLQPDMAKSLLEYRYQRLEAAKANAFSHGFKGAMFPWESADNGSEATPVWALTGPFQQHISATVGWAFWKYYQVTGDKQWLEDRAFPVLKEVADFWTSRVERKGEGQYEINNVIGANEYQENIDNNAFTNGMVKTVLAYTTQAANILGIQPDPDWMHVAENIPILKFEDGVTKENRTYKGEIIKQADVNLLSYPLKVVSKKEDIQKDLDYYAPKYSDNGPAMGPAILATLYARQGQPSEAYDWFIKGFQPNELPPFKVIAETAGGTNPYFATGAGGMLQSVLFGFGGLDITDNGVQQINSVLPKKWKSLKITGVGVEESEFEK